MILYLNTVSKDEIIIALRNSDVKNQTARKNIVNKTSKPSADRLSAIQPSAFRSSAARLDATKKIKVSHNQAEKLLPTLETFLKARKVKLSDLKKIVVASRGGSFTSLRIGVITANALAYALKIPVERQEKTGRKNKKFGRYSLVEPDYDREPNIGIPKSVLF